MTLKDKIEMQAQDTTKIYLYKEGIFYKVYNEGGQTPVQKYFFK